MRELWGRSRPALDQEIQARHLRHFLVGDDHREVLLLDEAEGLHRACARRDAQAIALERGLEGGEDNLLILDDEDGVGGWIRVHGGPSAAPAAAWAQG